MPDTGSKQDVFVDTPTCESSLASIQTNIFAVTCAFEYCHGTSPAAGLWLLDPKVERQLIGVRAGVCLDWVIVEPGSPERSLLWQKISSDHPPCRSERMPYGMGRLRPEAQSCIHDWIQSLPAASDAAVRD